MRLCRYADEPPEKIEVPDPTPSPKYKEQEEQFQKFFYEMSGEVGASNCCSSKSRKSWIVTYLLLLPHMLALFMMSLIQTSRHSWSCFHNV